ncbi:MAG: hypothetical protein E7282_09640 [Lachnospiraceae bacterium]|nr:hypothetical protein [Lachnospiraceae bacterium]
MKRKVYSRMLAGMLSAAVVAGGLAGCGAKTETKTTQSATESETEVGEESQAVTLICDGSASYKLEAEERDTDFDGNYVFAQYFEGKTQEDMISGIQELIQNGKVLINGIALPTSIDEITANENGEYCYTINGVKAFQVESGASAEDVLAGGLEAVTQTVKAAGTNVTFELDENGYATSMSLFVTRGALVDEIIDNGDGTSTLIADGAEYAISPDESPMPIPNENAAAPITIAFPNENISRGVEAGIIAVCWFDENGWNLKEADRMDGYLVGGADHEDYLFEDLTGTTHYFEDADMYNRAFATQNRPGGFVNTQVHFELTEGDYEVTAWFVPGTAETEKPMLIGFTTGDSSRPRLEASIAYAQNIADHAVVADSREEAGEDVDWVENQSTIDDLTAAIATAQKALDDNTLTDSAVDGAVYQLYLAVWGSMSDVSAVYSGTAVEGFYDIANPDVEKAAPVETN